MSTLQEVLDNQIDEHIGIKRVDLDLKSMPTFSEVSPGKGTIRLSRTGKGSISKTVEEEQLPTVLKSLIADAYTTARLAAQS